MLPRRGLFVAAVFALISCNANVAAAQSANHPYVNVDGGGAAPLNCETDIELHKPVLCEIKYSDETERGLFIPVTRTELVDKHRVTEVASTLSTLLRLKKSPADQRLLPFWLAGVVAIRKNAYGQRHYTSIDWKCLDVGELNGLGGPEAVQKAREAPETLNYLGLAKPPEESKEKIVLEAPDGNQSVLPIYLDISDNCSRIYGPR